MAPPPACNKILNDRLRPLRRSLKGVSRGNPSAIHAARIATRRLRELVPMLGLEQRVARQIVRRLRNGGRRLGKVRDVDTQLILAGELLTLDRKKGALLRRVRDDLADESARCRTRLANRKLELKLEKAARLLRNACDRADDRQPYRSHVIDSAPALMVRRTRNLRELLERVGAAYQPDALHRVRIAAKKLRYVAEVAGDVTGTPGAADIRLLKRTQDVLGKLRDAQVMLEHLRATVPASSVEGVDASGDYDRVSSLLETHGRYLHARFLRRRQGLLGLCRRWSALFTEASPRRQRDRQ